MFLFKKLKEINWLLLILLVFGYMNFDAKIFFIVSIVYYLYLLYKNRLKMIVPHVPGIRMYFIFIIYSSLIGLTMYTLRNVVRDMYYVLPTFLWIMIAYHLKTKDKEDSKDILKTLFVFGGFVALSSFVVFGLEQNMTFEAMRDVFGTKVLDVGFILPILIMKCIILKEEVFSKFIDRFLMIVMTLQVILSLGRVAILHPIIEIVVICALLIILNQHRRRVIKQVAVFVVIFAVVATLAYYLMPSELVAEFVEKVLRTQNEIDSSQMFSDVGAAMNNWRAYEIHMAQKQWQDSNFFVQMFGAGMGKGVKLELVPTTWKGVMEGDTIPLLHNGYFTLLPKGGLYAVLSLIIIFLGLILKGWRSIRQSEENMQLGITLIAINVAGAVSTYVVGGPVQQGTFLIWALLIGWICSELNQEEQVVEGEIEINDDNDSQLLQ